MSSAIEKLVPISLPGGVQLRPLFDLSLRYLLFRPQAIQNHFLNQQEVKARNLKLRSLPPVIDLEITRRCNLHCPMCLRQWSRLKEGNMKLGPFKEISGQFKHLIGVGFGGWGEHFLNKDFPYMLRYLGSKHIMAAFALMQPY